VRRSGLLALVALAALSACGSESSDGGGGSASSDAPAPKTSLTIDVTSREGAAPKTYTLTCDPAGGDHPQPTQACDAIAAAGPGVFEPVPSDAVCTMVLGGPEKATITGTYDGQDVDASFSRANGCEMTRWDKLGTTVFAVPLQ
jgi:hypothetical protein